MRIANTRDGRHILYAVNVNIKNGVATEKDDVAKASFRTSTPYATDNKLSSGESQEDENGVSYSLSEDSTGKQLTEGQKKYFKDSKVVDENGNLKVMYHGTEEAGFTKFNPDYGKSSKALFFTSSNDVAKTYSGTHDMYAPKSFKTAEEVTDYIHSYMDGDEEYTVEKRGKEYVLLDDGEFADSFKNIDDVFNGFLEYSGFGGSSANYAVYLNAKNPYVVDAKGANWDTLPELDGNTTTNGYADYAREHGYDGVIFKNISDSGLYASTQEKWGTSDVVAVFNPNQVKSVNNENPTGNEDIRFSLNSPVEETKNLVAVHNLTTKNLEDSLKLGGLPMPSIAVVKATQGHSKFGEISLVFNKDTIDPKKSTYNHLYGADAYTPTASQARIEYEANGIRKMPTGYFEAKPRRAVGFNEVVAAIVPDNMD